MFKILDKSATPSRKQNLAFTLAETLIALVIVGIVAALTVPSFVNKYHKMILETRLRQANTILANMIRMAEKDNGPLVGWNLNEYTNQVDSTGQVRDDFVNKYLLPYVHYKSYKRQTISNFGYKKGMFYPDGTYLIQPSTTASGITLANGVFILFGMKNFSVSSTGKKVVYKIDFYTDIDGPRGLNTVGKDIFLFTQPLVNAHPLTIHGEYSSAYVTYSDAYKNTALEMARSYKVPYICNTTTGEVTFFPGNTQTREQMMQRCKYGSSLYAEECGALIKLNNWKIPDDYPWL